MQGPGEVAQWLRTTTALTEDPNSVEPPTPNTERNK